MSEFSRRFLFEGFTVAAALSSIEVTAAGYTALARAEPAQPESSDLPVHRFNTVIPLYEHVTLLDFVGPHNALCSCSNIFFVADTLDPVVTDSGAQFTPTHTFEDVPGQVDVLMVPGSSDVSAVIADREFLNRIAEIGRRARYVTSVCTGSLLLGAAGLLTGYRAASHWTTLELLRLCGAQPVDDRYVIDRNRVTGSGVTAGLDFGFELVSMLAGQRAAMVSQLLSQYQPRPPFDAGHPDVAPKSVVEEALREQQDSTNRTKANLEMMLSSR